ncbi:ATP-NAD kinase family protein [Alteromonas halophila]|uniref:ATP-NAD kinase n=1 Tax=Alteromonas halophila TaxID=516698 RepID=A0A918JRB2_9ALTE|nr:ATP-NAD kinase family protein [Alteromonas halophila]GGW95062.1 ATP-NAD kinase [Alteromonas halophila]
MLEKVQQKVFRLGLIVNPFAGIGGALALKGSDGADIREKALAMGAEKQANQKMARALASLQSVSAPFHIYTASGDMGSSVCAQLALPYTEVYQTSGQTEATHTQAAASAMLEEGVDLLLFAGGDGTARNLCEVVAEQVPVLGVPAGCKIHSGVYAVTPSAAGEVLAMMIKGELVSEVDAEVRDIDEAAFRDGKVIARQFGEMRVPEALNYIQAVKMGGREDDQLVQEDIAAYLTEMMDDEPDTLFVMGSGSTVNTVMAHQDLANTLLGVDVVKNGEVIATDVTARQLQSLIDGQPAKIVVTVIGGQGHIFGRGNQQLSPAVIRQVGRQNLIIIATKQKLQALSSRPLIIDTGDAELDAELAGTVSVITGYRDRVLYPAR